jgi:hypothetical protein
VVCSFPNNKHSYCTSRGFLQGDSWISNFSIAGGWYYLALAISPPACSEAAGSKIRGAIILLASTVVGGWNAQIYIIKRAKKDVQWEVQ